MVDDGIGRLTRMEEQARSLGRTLKEILPKDIGFCLILFTYGEDGWLTYLSSGEREDMIKTLEETIQKIRTSPPTTRVPL